MSSADYFKQKAQLVNGRVQAFNHPAEAFDALAEACIAVPLLATSTLRVTGADRLDFLHGQLSNDVKRLAAGTFCDSLMLNHKGHALAQLRVFRLEDTLLAAIEGGAGAFVTAQLEAHIIFDQVALEPLDNVTLTVQGSRAQASLEKVLMATVQGRAFAEAQFEGEPVLISPSKRSAQGGFDLNVADRNAPLLFEHLLAAGAKAAGENVLDTARVSAGIANAEKEGGEGVLPQEAGLEPLVSYTKGCYLGQEIMARIEARGNVRRSLQGVRLQNLPSPDERDISAEGKRVGRLGTVVEHPGLGVLALATVRNDVKAGTALRVGATSAKVAPLPFTPDA